MGFTGIRGVDHRPPPPPGPQRVQRPVPAPETEKIRHPSRARARATGSLLHDCLILLVKIMLRSKLLYIKVFESKLFFFKMCTNEAYPHPRRRPSPLRPQRGGRPEHRSAPAPETGKIRRPRLQGARGTGKSRIPRRARPLLLLNLRRRLLNPPSRPRL